MFRGGLHEVGNALNLRVADKAALHADRLLAADGSKQHITPAKQLLRAAHIKDGAGVNLRGNRQGNTAGDIGLNQARDYVDGRTLRCNH